MYYDHKEPLFFEGDLSETIRNYFAKVNEKIDLLSKEQFLNTPEEELVEHFVTSLSIEPLVLFEDSKEMEQEEIEIDISGRHDRYDFGIPGPRYVRGVRVTVSVPYTGDPLLWKLRPNHYMSVFPRANVRKPGKDGIGHVDIIVEQPIDIEPDRFKSGIDRTLEEIRFYIDSQKKQMEDENAKLPDLVRRAIRNRHERLEKQEGIVKLLNIPLKRKEGSPDIHPIKIKRKLVRPLPPLPKSGFKPEPGIIMEVYEHILGVIRHEGRTFETTPKTFAMHDEEQLRDILLAHLNGHYKGGATGETFRKKGKTDIRIEEEDRAAFVAECKIWHGQKELLNACDQLLSYLTWRDCKAAIIIFNKNNSKFTELLSKVPVTLQQHSLFIKDLDHGCDGEWRYLFSSEEDEARRIYVHVFLFNIYCKT